MIFLELLSDVGKGIVFLVLVAYLLRAGEILLRNHARRKTTTKAPVIFTSPESSARIDVKDLEPQEEFVDVIDAILHVYRESCGERGRNPLASGILSFKKGDGPYITLSTPGMVDIMETGTARSFTLAFPSGMVQIGTIGRSGCHLNISNADLLQGSQLTIDSVRIGYDVGGEPGYFVKRKAITD